MVDPKFGTKRVCESCGGKFYDLNKNPLVCPLCGHSFDPNVASTPVAPVAKVASVQEPHEKDDDETPKDENEISLDEIVEEDGDEELAEFDDGAVLVDDEEDGDLLEDETGDDEFIEGDDDV
ncbi:MAG: TIGR02300 family protein [Pseudomonadota bacterium]|nr:TIGR02300 family protein [Pseudomonadota bacterium]